ncbi:MAG: hypothetical protein ACD_7C00536G0002 [uncultured bacterium]|nr:MAG: hypothetical protein ACD_7C00536G0002 [uncultured bacterium]
MVDVNTYGHRRDNLSLIPEKEYLRSRVFVINLVSRILSKWRIYIKPHPMWADRNIYLKKYYENCSRKVMIVDPLEPADKYIERSDIIVGFPPPSTTLFTSMLQDSNKIIFYVDLHHELLGDSFAGYKGIKYIDNLADFEVILKKIKNGLYCFKKNVRSKTDDMKSATDILEEII